MVFKAFIGLAAVLTAPAQESGDIRVVHAPSPAAAFRKQFQEPPRCLAVPKGLFHPLPPDLAALFSGDVRLAGAGESLGVLRREKDDHLHLLILRGERVAQEWYLKPPAPWQEAKLPKLQLSENGQWVVLMTSKGFAVYAGSELVRVLQEPEHAFATSVAVMGEQVIWCTKPPQVPKDNEPPTLCFQQSLTAAKPEPFLQANAQVWQALIRQAKGNVDRLVLSELQVLLTPRRDRKFWALGLHTGELFLLARSGTVAKHWILPWAIKGLGENRDLVSWGEEQMRAKVAEHLGSKLFDATKPQAVTPASLAVANSIFSAAFSRDNDLVAMTHPAADPANALFWIENDPLTSRCFLLKDFEAQMTDLPFLQALRVAVTRDRLWLASPAGYLVWDELLSYWEERQKSSEKNPEHTQSR